MCMDVAFDEDFVSAGLCYNRLLFHDALPTRGTESYVDDSRDIAHTRPPHGLKATPYPIDMDSPHLSATPSLNFEDDFKFVDEFDNHKPPAVIQSPVTQTHSEEYEVESILAAHRASGV